MKVGILGSSTVAQSLAAGFIKYNNQVMLSSRTPAKLTEWVQKSPGSKAGSFSEAAAFGDIIVLAVKGMVAADVLNAAGIDNLKDKIVIDATNPIADQAPEKGILNFFTSFKESLMEQLQKAYPQVKFVKAFSSVGSASMVNPRFKGGKPTMFICGNDNTAKNKITEILDQFGWETEDMGDAEAARAIEPLCILWCIPGFLRNDWVHAFKMLR
ncbi:MAG: NAD(P)-binding domain-containing protein [Calditrichaceae bacterium]|nr:NAD(P)-binding domain-containing protein [Calditrichaceae bacterium]